MHHQPALWKLLGSACVRLFRYTRGHSHNNALEKWLSALQCNCLCAHSFLKYKKSPTVLSVELIWLFNFWFFCNYLNSNRISNIHLSSSNRSLIKTTATILWSHGQYVQFCLIPSQHFFSPFFLHFGNKFICSIVFTHSLIIILALDEEFVGLKWREKEKKYKIEKNSIHIYGCAELQTFFNAFLL